MHHLAGPKVYRYRYPVAIRAAIRALIAAQATTREGQPMPLLDPEISAETGLPPSPSDAIAFRLAQTSSRRP
jgi:hypothetical protein